MTPLVPSIASGAGTALLLPADWQAGWLDGTVARAAAVTTVVVALYTGSYAWQPRRTAPAARVSAARAHRRQRDAVGPAIVAETVADEATGQRPSLRRFAVELRNVGSGPALDVEARVEVGYDGADAGLAYAVHVPPAHRRLGWATRRP